MFKKILFGLVAALAFLFTSLQVAHAAIPATGSYLVQCPWNGMVGSRCATSNPAPIDSLDNAGCNQAFGGTSPGTTYTGVYFPGGGSSLGTCHFYMNGVDQSSWGISLGTGTCPPNSTLAGSMCTCNAGYEESGGTQCLPANPICEIGKGHTFNRTEGWARSPNPDADDMLAPTTVPNMYGYNDGACVGNIVNVDMCYRGQVPTAQGLYRVSCDYTMVVTGSAQSSGEQNSNPSEPDAACPGFVGEVNGKTVCVGTASNPLPSDSPAPNKPTQAGNPSAGAKPSTGEGSGSTGAGRTPTAGSGGNAGGPAGAAVGRGGTGDRGEDGEDANAVCGAAPLPACAVKVDETGVPAEGTADGKFAQAGTDLGKVQTDAIGAFGDHQNISLPGWTWTFQFPTGCTPLVLGAFDDLEIDVCQWQPIIHDLMSMLWIIAGIWGLIDLFRRTTGA